jgi:hypothetical protein
MLKTRWQPAGKQAGGPPHGNAWRRVRSVLVAAALTAVAGLGSAVIAPPASAGPNGVELVNQASGLRADVMWASTAWEQGVFLWPDNTSWSQRFDMVDVGDGSGHFTLRAKHSGQCLYVGYWLTGFGNGSKIVQYPCDPGRWEHQWRIHWVWIPGTSFGYRMTLKNRATGKCLDAANGAFPRPPGQQAVLQQWDCIARGDAPNWVNQTWQILDFDYVGPR